MHKGCRAGKIITVKVYYLILLIYLQISDRRFWGGIGKQDFIYFFSIKYGNQSIVLAPPGHFFEVRKRSRRRQSWTSTGHKKTTTTQHRRRNKPGGGALFLKTIFGIIRLLKLRPARDTRERRDITNIRHTGDIHQSAVETEAESGMRRRAVTA